MGRGHAIGGPLPAVISNGASRRIFFPFRSCETVGLRREKSLFSLRAAHRSSGGKLPHPQEKPRRQRGCEDNIKGNDYRLVVAVHYRLQIVFIKWLGSHAEYDKIDVKTVTYGH
jgi:hypothetical protein